MPLAAIATKLKRLDVGDRLLRRNPLYYSAVQRELARLAAADEATRRAWEEERLARILKAAARTRYGASVGGHVDIGSWPLLRKESIRDHSEAFIRAAAWGGQLFNAHASTGGTTGVPLQLMRSPESVVVEQVCQDAALMQAGVHPLESKIAVLRGDDIKSPSDLNPPFWIDALGGRRLILSSIHLSERTLPAYVQALRAFAPDVLWVYPTTLESLCLLLASTGTHLRVPTVMSSSEMLQPNVWTLAQQLLGCRLVDRYGQAERVACAHAFELGVYRFVPGYSHVELLLDDEDADAKLYEIVGTSLWNTAMPLVRYRTGDLIRLPKSYGPCELSEIALGMRSFEGVIGRSNDVLIDATGTRVLAGINQIPRGVQHLLRLQVVQEEPARVTLRALPGPGFSAADAAQLLRNARLKIPESVDVQIEIASELQRTNSGKTPFVVHGAAVRETLRNVGLRSVAA